MIESCKFDDENIFPEYIESERLEYVPVHLTDIPVREFAQLYMGVSEEETMHVKFSPHETSIEAKQWIDECREGYESGDSFSYAVFEKESGEFIGTAGFEPDWERKKAESGVFLFSEYWGNGYGTERGETMVDLAFNVLDLEVYFSRPTVENEASIRSIEKYVVGNGGERVGVLPNYKFEDSLRDIYLYTLRKEDCELTKD